MKLLIMQFPPVSRHFIDTQYVGKGKLFWSPEKRVSIFRRLSVIQIRSFCCQSGKKLELKNMNFMSQ
jgi:hypothetical protein